MQAHLSESRHRSELIVASGLRLSLLVLGLLLLFAAQCVKVHAQAISAPAPRTTLLLPEANHLPDVNDRMKLNAANQKKQNFDAANSLRQQQISDEATKLLILANDLQRQMQKLGDKPLPDRLIREAEVIEVLARDVQTKMTMTISGS
jgi:hypothetical protein